MTDEEMQAALDREEAIIKVACSIAAVMVEYLIFKLLIG